MASEEDSKYIEAGENTAIIIQKLETNPNALGILDTTFLTKTMIKLKVRRLMV